MIITRTPFRVPLGGGGTDLPAYYTRYGGDLTSAAINKYMYIAVKRSFDNKVRVSYARTEIVDHASQLEHPIVREVLDFLGVHQGLEIISIADVPANTGLGSSGSFTVGLLLALHTFKREHRTSQELAEESFMIQAERLGEPIGKQDEYLAACGGVTNLAIDTSGQVVLRALRVTDDMLREFEHNLLLFYTGIQRKSSDILAQQQRAITRKQPSASSSLHQIKKIGQQITVALEDGKIDRVGKLMHEHWVCKQRISKSMAPDDICRWYNLGLQHGALGGKLVGAGGGGFLLFYCNRHQPAVRQALTAAGLREVHFSFEHGGAKVIVDLEERRGPSLIEQLRAERPAVRTASLA